MKVGSVHEGCFSLYQRSTSRRMSPHDCRLPNSQVRFELLDEFATVSRTELLCAIRVARWYPRNTAPSRRPSARLRPRDEGSGPSGDADPAIDRDGVWNASIRLLSMVICRTHKVTVEPGEPGHAVGREALVAASSQHRNA